MATGSSFQTDQRLDCATVDFVQLYEADDGEQFAIEFHHGGEIVARVTLPADAYDDLIEGLRNSQLACAERRTGRH